MKSLNRLVSSGVLQAYLLIFSVQLVFAGYQLLAKVALSGHGVDPIAFAVIRGVGSTVLLFLVAFSCEPRELLLPQREHMTRFLMLGFFMVCNVLGLILALSVTTSATVAILQIMRPVFAGLISWMLGMEKFTLLQLFGILICMSGTYMIATAEPQQEAASHSSFFGILCVTIHSLGQASYVLVQPTLLQIGYSSTMINASSYLVAAAFFMVLSVFPFHSGSWWLSSVKFVVVTLWSIFLVGAYSYAAMGWAAKRVGGTTVMLFMLLQAILTVVGGNIFLGEVILAIQVEGGVLIMIGISLYVFGPNLCNHSGAADLPSSETSVKSSVDVRVKPLELGVRQSESDP